MSTTNTLFRWFEMKRVGKGANRKYVVYCGDEHIPYVISDQSEMVWRAERICELEETHSTCNYDLEQELRRLLSEAVAATGMCFTLLKSDY